MFGLLSPATKNADYCRAYSHLCKAHRKFNGIALLPFLSYESVFLYMLSVDAGIATLSEKTASVCCRFSKYSSPLSEADSQTSQFCAAFSTLLAYVKLKDNVEDEGDLKAKITIGLFRSRIQKAFDFFQEIDANFKETIDEILSSHAKLEAGSPSMGIEDFSAPTARGFGYLFSLLAVSWQRPDLKDFMRNVGSNVGSAIVLFDVAYDYKSDLAKRHYNPMENANSRPHVVWTAKKHLEDAAGRIQAVFGNASLGSKLLRLVNETLIMDASNSPKKLPSHFDEAMLAQCTPGAAFGFFPRSFLAESSSDNDIMCKILALAGCAWCANHFLKSQCGCTHVERETRSDGRTTETVLGPCGRC